MSNIILKIVQKSRVPYYQQYITRFLSLQSKKHGDARETNNSEVKEENSMLQRQKEQNLFVSEERNIYKCLEYFKHTSYSYYDLDSACAERRLPQPNPNFK